MPKSKLGIYVISLGGVDVIDYVRHARPRMILSLDHNLDTNHLFTEPVGHSGVFCD